MLYEVITEARLHPFEEPGGGRGAHRLPSPDDIQPDPRRGAVDHVDGPVRVVRGGQTGQLLFDP